MTWPFLSSMRNAAAVSPATSQATAHLTPAQQLLLAPRAVHRRRYLIFLPCDDQNKYSLIHT